MRSKMGEQDLHDLDLAEGGCIHERGDAVSVAPFDGGEERDCPSHRTQFAGLLLGMLHHGIYDTSNDPLVRSDFASYNTIILNFVRRHAAGHSCANSSECRATAKRRPACR